MTLPEFVRLVGQMRDAQKTYFLTHTQSALYVAKDLERRVDIELLQWGRDVEQMAMWSARNDYDRGR